MLDKHSCCSYKENKGNRKLKLSIIENKRTLYFCVFEVRSLAFVLFSIRFEKCDKTKFTFG